VVDAWEGLGYYTRARNAHRAAKIVRERHDGNLPSELAALRTLPGFGSYTAGAVASIAFGACAPAVDGNVRRVLSRLLDLAAPSAGELGARAARLVDPERPGDFNQALMDLGATVCTPRAPRCDACPLRPECLAAARGTTLIRPQVRSRGAIPQRSFVVLALVDAGDRTLLVRRPRTGLLAGLWSFPEYELTTGLSKEEARSIALEIALDDPAREVLGPERGEASPLPEVRHAFTHFRARYVPWIFRYATIAPPGPAQRRWVRPSDPGLALPAAQKRIMACLSEWLASDQDRG
jgi:A/G-specific adenine glycosylase